MDEDVNDKGAKLRTGPVFGICLAISGTMGQYQQLEWRKSEGS